LKKHSFIGRSFRLYQFNGNNRYMQAVAIADVLFLPSLLLIERPQDAGKTTGRRAA
jgi:hypothetical protein